MIPQIAAAFLPGAVSAATNAIGQMAGAGTGNVAGRVAGAGLGTGNVFEALNKAGIKLDPNQEAQLQNHYAREAGQDQLSQGMQGAAFNAGLGNTAANLNTERSMAMNAQQNAANNVANQLSALRDRANSNANVINNAMNSAAGMFR